AILDANDTFTTGRSTIAFNIPGAGIQTIAPSSPLPAITKDVLVNGFTQAGAQANSSATMLDATLLIRLDGVIAGDGTDGLQITASDATIRGLIVTGFKGAGIHSIDAKNIGIAENFIGTTSLPGTAASNSTGNATGIR